MRERLPLYPSFRCEAVDDVALSRGLEKRAIVISPLEPRRAVEGDQREGSWLFARKDEKGGLEVRGGAEGAGSSEMPMTALKA